MLMSASVPPSSQIYEGKEFLAVLFIFWLGYHKRMSCFPDAPRNAYLKLGYAMF